MATNTSVKAKIKEILETKKGAGQPLSQVYGYWEVQPEAFPCAMVEILDTGDKRLTTAENEITSNFKIRIAIKDTNDEGESTLRLSLIDTIRDLFNTVPYVDTLDGEATKFDFGKAFAFNKNEDMAYSGFDITMTVNFIKLIT